MCIDLPHRLSHYHLSYEDLNKVCDDDLFSEILEHIDNLKKVGNGLRVSSKYIDSISQKDENDVERKADILYAWKAENSTTATFIKLIIAFLNMENKAAVDSILKYLSKRSTSESYSVTYTLNPQKAKKHYPNWERLSDHDKERTRNKLMAENRDVRKAYTVFIYKLKRSFTQRNVDPSDVQSIVNSFSSAEVFSFSKDDNIGTTFTEITSHCTWFNYESLKVIVEILCDDTESKYLKTYEDKHLKPYLDRSIFEIPCNPSRDQSRADLLFKVPIELTGNQVKAIQQNLAVFLGFDSSAIFHFESYEEGCIDLIFSLPKVVLLTGFTNFYQPFTNIVREESRNCYRAMIDLFTVL